MKRVCILMAMLLCVMLAFSAQAVETTAGESVVVPISINASGACQITVLVSIDANLFEFVNIRCEASGGQASFNEATQTGRMVMYDISSPISAGRIGYITLKVKEGVELGSYNITALVLEAWSLDEQPVQINATAETIIVKCPHLETEEKITKEQGCESNGTKQVVCLECGEVVEEIVLPALGHKYETWEVTKNATCIESGVETSCCENCGKADTREIPALGHKEVVMKAVKPTCIETGLTEGTSCSVCGEIITRQEVLPANGHTIVNDEAVVPTCTEKGYTEGSYCSACGEIFIVRTEIPAKGHEEAAWIIIDYPTTIAEGYREKRCPVCEYVFESRIIPKLEMIEDIPDPVIATIDAKKGETVTLDVYVRSNKASLVTVQLNYDASVFEFVSSTCELGLANDGRYVVYSLTDIIDSKIGTITLKLIDEVEDGVYTVAATVVEAFDYDENPVVCKAAVDKVSVVSRLPGDVNEDGIVDGRDLLRLAKHIGGFDVVINEANSTVNGDNIIDGRDLLRLAKFIGGQDVELK